MEKVPFTGSQTIKKIFFDGGDNRKNQKIENLKNMIFTKFRFFDFCKNLKIPFFVSFARKFLDQ